ncbi:putative lipase atg15 [Blastocladiella emersonii ATCC 22665]|nr:putative lipase atg15 [Blastocladiella emersonii ATCC 22665]
MPPAARLRAALPLAALCALLLACLPAPSGAASRRYEAPDAEATHTLRLAQVLHRPMAPPETIDALSAAAHARGRGRPDPPARPVGGVYALDRSSGSASAWADSSFEIRTSPPAPVSPLSGQALYQSSSDSFFASGDDSAVSAADDDAAIPAPDVTDKDTVLAFAKMTANAYTLPTNGDWEPLDHFFTNESFGWTDDGLRGYVYANAQQDLAIIDIKGTTAVFLGIGGDTAPKDKLNDNRMFSCCCAHVDRTWRTVCDCFRGSSQCDAACLRNATSYESSYYAAGQDLYKATSLLYPNATIWLTGHSLGGALSSLLATTYRTAAVTFEAPGERLFAERLGLIGLFAEDTAHLPIYHFGHNADPIFIGRCRGPRSSCYFAGYAMETKCHLGRVCTYAVREALDGEDAGDDAAAVRVVEAPPRPPADDDAEVKWWPGWGSGNSTTTPPSGSEPTTTPPAPAPEPTPTQPIDETPRLGWGVDIRHHRIHEVIDYVISAWPTVPQCTPQAECRDCSGWKFV